MCSGVCPEASECVPNDAKFVPNNAKMSQNVSQMRPNVPKMRPFAPGARCGTLWKEKNLNHGLARMGTDSKTEKGFRNTGIQVVRGKSRNSTLEIRKKFEEAKFKKRKRIEWGGFAGVLLLFISPPFSFIKRPIPLLGVLYHGTKRKAREKLEINLTTDGHG